jgi:hypothetical protein
MSTIINATTTNGVVIEPDNSGSLELQTNSGTTALTIDTSQNATFAGTLTATGKLVASSMPTGSVLQVVSTIKTNTFTTSSASLVDVTGLSVSITPTSASSKILVLVNVRGTSSNGTAHAGDAGIVLVRNSTNIAVSTGGSFYNWMGQLSGRNIGSTAVQASASVAFLDSPATTSSITYKIQGLTAGGTLFINRDEDGGNGSVSTITVMEIQG